MAAQAPSSPVQHPATPLEYMDDAPPSVAPTPVSDISKIQQNLPPLPVKAAAGLG